MVTGKENKSQIDGDCADLPPYGICEIACGGFRIGLARESGRELKRGGSGRACGMSRHSMHLSYRLSVPDTSDPWVHPFWAVLRQLVIVAPHVRMIIVKLCQGIVQFCGILWHNLTIIILTRY